MAKLQSTEIVGVANRPATICSNTICLWFDTTNLRPMVSYCGYGFGAWSAGGALITARCFIQGGAGTQNAGLAAGGGNLSCTEEYNGTSWSTGGPLTTTKCSTTGTQNEGLAIGGGITATEEYNGTSWAAGGALITLTGGGLSGTQNAGLAASRISNTVLGCTEEYNGTSWASAGNTLYFAGNYRSAGSQNSTISYLENVGNEYSYFNDAISLYDGTSWSTAPSPSATTINDRSFIGTQNAAFLTGGTSRMATQNSNAVVSFSEKFDGVSWYTDSNFVTPRGCLAGAGTQQNSVFTGGKPNFGFTASGCTEEYSSTLQILSKPL